MALLWPLGICVLLASLVATLRLELESRSERLVAVALFANVFAVLPIYILGSFHSLTRAALGVVLAALAMAGLVASRARWGALRALLVELTKTPVVVLRDTVRDSAPIGIIALGVTGYALFGLIAAFYAPTWRSFDALWYHEPIVGFAIQNKGFSWVNLPVELHVVNANPRASEMLQVFFALYGGRRLVDLASVFAFMGFGIGLHALLGRFTSSAAMRFGFTVTVLLIPGFFLQLGTTYVDVHVTALLVVAWFYSTGPVVTRKHLVLVALALMLSLGAKATAYLPGVLTALVAGTRYTLRERRLRAAIEPLVMLAVSVSLSLVTFTRNALHFRNPFYPIPVEISRFGIDWPGIGRPFADKSVNEPMLDVWKTALGPPGGDGLHVFPFFVLPHTQREAASAYNYGYAAAWVLVPFGCAAIAYLGIRWALARLHRSPLTAEGQVNLGLLLGSIGVIHVMALHYLHLVRYHGIIMVLLVVGIVLAAEVLEVPRWGLALAGGGVFLSLTTLSLQEPRCFLLPHDIASMRNVGYPDRETTPQFGSPSTLQGGRFRAREFKKDTVVAFTDNLQQIAPLWNDDYSNKVAYVRGGSELPKDLDSEKADFYVCNDACSREALNARFRPTVSLCVFGTSTIFVRR